jgi:hypothetical protein
MVHGRLLGNNKALPGTGMLCSYVTPTVRSYLSRLQRTAAGSTGSENKALKLCKCDIPELGSEFRLNQAIVSHEVFAM